MDFEAAYARYHLLVLARCRRLLADGRDAEDAAQEVWIKAWRAWERMTFTTEGALPKWLHALTRNECIDRWRYARSRPRVIGAPDERAPGTMDVEAAVLLDADVRQVLDALDAMPQAGATMLLLVGAGYAPHEIVAAGTTWGTVRGAMHRARAELRKRVA